MHSHIAKSNPTPPVSRLTAFKRAQSLDNGISISWYEQTWSKDVLTQTPLKSTDFALLKQLGIKSIRLPVAFEHFETEHIPVEQLFTHIDNFVKQCDQYGFKLIIDYHYGNLNDTNYNTETTTIINLWLKLTKRYLNKGYNNVFFELYNEPVHMNPQIWKDAAYNIVTAIRKIDKQRTLIIGASNFNSIYELSRFVRLADENVIYTFHFYEPFLFTHQGAEWIGDQESTVGVPFPYNAEKFPALNEKAKNTDGEKNYNKYHLDGNEGSVRDKLQIVKNWAAKYDVPVICGEYGVYNKYADIDSRCRYIKAVRQTLKTLNIPGMLWDYSGTFSLFNGEPSIASLPDCMKDAIGYTGQK
ncbi:glycoside hydrolase family 5 protein [Mucilaginibacter sp.]|uniref:glycoside hydrolase family 5 protein n=1 Tax=Mucilaginibacter sp. TaxID=1882438 RepID=UPI003D0FB82C